MTTLFNLFCPFVADLNIFLSIIFMVIFTFMTCAIFTIFFDFKMLELLFGSISPLIMGAIVLAFLNLISLVCYSYPVTTTLSLNFMVAVTLWLASLLLLMFKPNVSSNVLPANSPWYLVPFLSLVEFVSLLVRPVTLSFRLLANMSAGHILLSLICKMELGLWFLGSMFGLLELMVCVVQAFVFFMLVSVYFEEGLTH